MNSEGQDEASPGSGSADEIEVVELDEEFDEYDDDGGEVDLPGSTVGSLVFSPAALALAAFGVGLVSMAQVQAATDIADTYFATRTAQHLTTLSAIRLSTTVRLVLAVIAVVLAWVAAARLRREEIDAFLDADGESVEDDLEAAEAPRWVRALVGGAVVLAVVAVLLAAVAFGYAFASHANPQRFAIPG